MKLHSKALKRYRASDELPVVFNIDHSQVFSVDIAPKHLPGAVNVLVETLRRWARVKEEWEAVQEEMRRAKYTP